MNATWFACLQRFKIQAAVMNTASIETLASWVRVWLSSMYRDEINAACEREIFWKLICVCFHTLWAACRHEWCLRRDGGSDCLTAPGAPSAWGEGGFKLHKQVRKMFTLHSGTWKCAKPCSTKAEKIVPNKMKGFTCQLTVYHRLHSSNLSTRGGKEKSS